jgi:hypothetical protein
MYEGCSNETRSLVAKAAVMRWFRERPPREFFAEGIHRLVPRWDAYLSVHEDSFYRTLVLRPEQFPNEFNLNRPHILYYRHNTTDQQ